MSGMRNILDNGWIRVSLLGGMFYVAIDLTFWAKAFASTALATKADLMGAAAMIGAVASAPIAILTLLVTKYLEFRGKNGAS